MFQVLWKIFRHRLVMTLWAFFPKNHLWEGFFGSAVWNISFWVLGGDDLEPSYHSRSHIKRKKFCHGNFENEAIFSRLAVKIHKWEKIQPHHWKLLTKTLLNWIVLFCTPKKKFSRNTSPHHSWNPWTSLDDYLSRCPHSAISILLIIV